MLGHGERIEDRASSNAIHEVPITGLGIRVLKLIRVLISVKRSLAFYKG
jgi:hypothetical protein